MEAGHNRAVAVGLFAIAGSIVLHSCISLKIHQRQDHNTLSGTLTGNLTGTLQSADSHMNRPIMIGAAPFDPEGGAIVRSATGQWYRIWVDGRVSLIGMDRDLWEHAVDPEHAASHSIWDPPISQPAQPQTLDAQSVE